MKLHEHLWGDDWVEVFYYAVPVGCAFVHQDRLLVKLHDDESTDYGGQVYDYRDDRFWGFEAHHGAIISQNWFDEWGLEKENIRE